MIEVCGIDCKDCSAFVDKSCAGCRSIQGKVSWASYLNLETCPIYNCCVNEKKLEHCGQCDQLPCNIHYDTRDPSYSIEEHKKDVERRAQLLKSLV